MFASLGGQPPAAQRRNGTGTEPRLGANGLGLKRLQCHFGSWENDGTTLQNPWKNTKSWENDEKKDEKRGKWCKNDRATTLLLNVDKTKTVAKTDAVIFCTEIFSRMVAEANSFLTINRDILRCIFDTKLHEPCTLFESSAVWQSIKMVKQADQEGQKPSCGTRFNFCGGMDDCNPTYYVLTLAHSTRLKWLIKIYLFGFKHVKYVQTIWDNGWSFPLTNSYFSRWLKSPTRYVWVCWNCPMNPGYIRIFCDSLFDPHVFLVRSLLWLVNYR